MLKISLRYLWRNRLFTGLNVIGLAVGISICWAIIRIAAFEYSFDKNIPDAEHVFRVVNRSVSDGREALNAGIPKPLAIKLDEIAGIEAVVPYWYTNVNKVSVPKSKEVEYSNPEAMVSIGEDYFSIVPYKWLAGNPKTAMKGHNKVVLAESRARAYFPETKFEAILGEAIVYDTTQYSVSGIVADPPVTTSFYGQEFIPIERNFQDWEWGSLSSGDAVYIKLASNTDIAKIKSQINSIYNEGRKKNGLLQYGQSRVELIPLHNVHFSEEYGEVIRKTNKKTLLYISAIGVFILVLSCVNYINLSTAQIPHRSKEIGVYKTLGGSNFHIVSRFLVETATVVLISVGIAYFIYQYIFTHLTEFVPKGIDQFSSAPLLTIVLVGMLLAVIIISGVLPAWMATKLKPVSVLKKQPFQTYRNGFGFRKGLIVFQFAVTQVFIAGAILAANQLRYMISEGLGFDTEAIIHFSVEVHQDSSSRLTTLRNEIAKIKEVQGVTTGGRPFDNGFSSTGAKYFDPEGRVTEHQVFQKYVDADFLSIYNIPVVAGQPISENTASDQVIVNETLLHDFGLKTPDEAIGKQLTYLNGEKIIISGVIRDYHDRNFRERLSPLILKKNFDKNNWMTLGVKFSKNRETWQNGIVNVGAIWQQFFPGKEFDYKFYDKQIAQMYASDQKAVKLIKLSTALAVLVSCLGLFGLSTLVAAQRSKEISIRKVLGATVAQIVGLLSSDFVRLVAIAMVISVPIAWFLIQKWLTNFAYRIEVEWWIFGAVGIVALLIALISVGFQAIKTAIANPVRALRAE